VTATAIGTFWGSSAAFAIFMFPAADRATQFTSAMVCHVTIAITYETPQRPWNILFYTEQHVTKFDLTSEVSSRNCRNIYLDSVISEESLLLYRKRLTD